MSQVIDEITLGDSLSLAQAARLVPAYRGDSGHANPSTVWRWITVGAKSTDGRVVKLEAARFGQRWVTSRAAVTRFIAALTPNQEPAPSPRPARSEKARRKTVDAATKKLIAMGA